MITQTYNIDLIPSGVPTIVHVSQYDSASRTIAMNIYDGGVAYDLTDKIVTVRGTKSDNTGFEYPCTVNGNVASFVLNAQMTIFSGDVPCEIRIAENGFVIGSHNFVLRVERTPLDSSIVISDTELPLIEEAEQNAIRAEQAADEAETLLSTVVKSVNSVTPDAQGNVDIDASAIPYDNTSSGLSATDVQSAIDETSALGSTTLPLMDGTASVGTEQTYARGDHVHPTDTSRAAKTDLTINNISWSDKWPIPDRTDFNNIKKVGVHFVRSDASKATMLNSPPTGNAGMLTNSTPLINTNIGTEISGAGQYILQEYVSYVGEKYRRVNRSNESGTWTYGQWIQDMPTRLTPTYASGVIGSSCNFYKVGSIVIASLIIYLPASALGTQLITGLPKTVNGTWGFTLKGTDNAFVRMYVNHNGYITNNTASEARWYEGFVVYVAES